MSFLQSFLLGIIQGLTEFIPVSSTAHLLIGQWLLGGPAQGRPLSLTPDDFELMAWRLLGDGMLLIDMYDQWSAIELADSTPAALDALNEPQVQRAIQWWRKLRL